MCLNWNIENGTCSKELVKDIGGHAKKPFQLSLETQKEKSQLIFNDVANGRLKKTTAMKQLKSLNLNTDCIDLILDTATIKRCVKSDTLNMHDLSGFHYLTGLSKKWIWLSGFCYLQKIMFTYDVLTCSPMHLFPLG